MRSRNACKTCALGMGGQRGGMVNELGRFPEVCKKSVQAMAADMQGRIREGFFAEFDFDALERFSPRELEHAGRLTVPLYAGPGDRSYREVAWDEALDRVSSAMRAADPEDTFFYFSGRSSNEAAFLLQLAARLYGTNNVNNCSYFCHQASGVALTEALGVATSTVTLDDLDECDFVMLLGANPASNHPRLMRTLMDLRRRDGHVVVVNPIRELGLVNFSVPSDPFSLLLGTPIASEYLQPHIAGDIALLYGIAKALLDHPTAIDHAFIHARTDGFERFRARTESLTWTDIEAASGVDRGQIHRVAASYASARNAVFCWTMGMTHHAHGVDNVRMITNLALMRGMVGRPGAGLLPLRGHSNVQGVGSVGATPALKDHVLRAIEKRFGVALPTSPGMDTLACVRRAAESRVKFAWHLGGNLYGSCPDATEAGRALRRIGTTVFLSTTLNTGHIYGRGSQSFILPVRARDEEPQPTTQESMFSYVRLSDGGPARFDGPRSEVEVIASVFRRAIGNTRGVNFDDLERHADIRRAIAEIIPGYAPAADMDRMREEFRVEGRSVEGAVFPTTSGRAAFHAPEVPRFPPLSPPTTRSARPVACELRLMTIRSEGQFNTVVYEEQDVYRGQDRRDVIMMNPADIARLGLRVNDHVTVSSDAGEMRGMLVRELDIREGNAAMYYPEANRLVPARADERSRTPAFKSVAVRVAKESPLPVLH